MTTATLDPDRSSSSMTPPRATRRQWVGLAVMTLPLFMLSTDLTVLILAMPAITADLAPVGSQSLWILHIGEFLAAASILIFGLLTRRIGARRVLLGAVAAYGGASLLAAYAVNAEMLIAARGVLGIAAGAFTPAGMTLIRATFRDERQYSLAFAIFLAAFSGGMAAGPPFGGLMLEHVWWGAVFLINVPIAAVLLIGGPLLLTRTPADPEARFDPVSVGLSVVAILALVFGLQELADGGFDTVPALATLTGIGLVGVFIRRQRHTPAPLVDLSLFRLPWVRPLLLVLFTVLLATTVSDMLIASHLQVVRGMGTLEVGLVLLVPALAATVGTVATPLLTRSPRPAMAGAAVLALAGLSSFTVIPALAGGNLVSLIAALTGLALFVSPFITLVSQRLISAAPEEKTGPVTAVQDVVASLGTGASFAFVGAGTVGVYRHLLAREAPADLAASDVGAAGESFGGSVAVIERLGGRDGDRLFDAVDTALTGATQTGFVIGGVAMVGIAAVAMVFHRRLSW